MHQVFADKRFGFFLLNLLQFFLILQGACLFNVTALVYNYGSLNFVELLLDLGLAITNSIHFLALLADRLSVLENFDTILDALFDNSLLSYLLFSHNRYSFFFQVTLVFRHILNFLFESLIVFLLDQSYFFGLLAGFVNFFEHFSLDLLQFSNSIYYHHCVAV